MFSAQGKCGMNDTTIHAVVGMGGADLETDRKGGQHWLEYIDEHHHGYVLAIASNQTLTMDYYQNNDTTCIYDTVT